MNHLMAEMSAVRALIDSVPGGDGLIAFGEKTPAPETLRRLHGEIQKMVNDGHRVSMIAVHPASRSGAAFRPDAVMCSQSTVKAIYVGALLERFPEALAEQRERIRETIVLSSNEAYESLRDLYGPEVIRTWCRETGVAEGFADAPYPRAYSARDLLKLWTRLYCFLNGGSEAAAGVGGYFENSALSAARERLGGRCRVHTKAGWENGVGDDVTDFAHAVIPKRFTDGDPLNDECATNDSGIVYAGNGPYLFVIYSDYPCPWTGGNRLAGLTDALYEYLEKL
ncbi:MAG: serine hydrolase [Clostridia bacterium]|nr:serine hydrolase [Clostridia bacterium]